jgi:hypothetical protein
MNSSRIVTKLASALKCFHKQLWLPMKKNQLLALKKTMNELQFLPAVMLQEIIN